MKKIMPHIAGVFFAVFGVGIIVLLMSYTWQALARIFPDTLVAQAMGMILFDIAALAWLLAFIYLCKSVMQYAFAFIGFAFGMLGTLGMVGIEVMLGGQELIIPPAWVNEALIYTFIGAAVVHVVLFYAFKLAAPEISAEISLGVETAQITEEAMKQAEANLIANRNALGAVIAPRLIANVKRNLGLPVGDVLDLPAQDINDLSAAIPVQIPPRKKAGIADRLKAAAQAWMNPPAPVAPEMPRKFEADAPAAQPKADEDREGQTSEFFRGEESGV